MCFEQLELLAPPCASRAADVLTGLPLRPKMLDRVAAGLEMALMHF
jgi:hypothetical protein